MIKADKVGQQMHLWLYRNLQISTLELSHSQELQNQLNDYLPLAIC